MRTIIAGSRTSITREDLLTALETCDWKVTTIISGGAKGADAIGELYAKSNDIPLEVFKADWDKLGRGAGAIRNTEMANNANALIALWDGKSRGTGHMIYIANKLGLKVHVHTTGEQHESI